MTEFRTAEGTCEVVDDVLHIDRPNSQLGRWWVRIRRNSEQYPGRALAYFIGISLLLLLAIIALMVVTGGVASTIEVWFWLLQSVLLPLLILVIVVLGIVYGIVSLKARKVRQREGIETLVRPESIPLDDVTKVVSVTPANVEILYVFYQESGEEMVTPIAFMQGMGTEVETTKQLFRNHSIPIESGN